MWFFPYYDMSSSFQKPLNKISILTAQQGPATNGAHQQLADELQHWAIAPIDASNPDDIEIEGPEAPRLQGSGE
jgi:hypothetical protein